MRRRPSRLLAMQRIVTPPAARLIVPTAAPPTVAPGYVAGLISASPAPGRFYQVKVGDTISDIVRSALNAYQGGLGDLGTTRLAFIHCATAGPRWNRHLYASDYVTEGFPAMYAVDGRTLARAFWDWHDDAPTALTVGRWPRRRVEQGGARIPGGQRYALLWMPTIDGFVFHEGAWLPVCADLDPPAILLDTLRAQGGGTI